MEWRFDLDNAPEETTLLVWMISPAGIFAPMWATVWKLNGTWYWSDDSTTLDEVRGEVIAWCEVIPPDGY